MKMNIARNMEAIFLVTIALTCVTAYAAAPVKHSAAAPAATIVDGEMTVVTVTGRRLTPAQKAGLVD
jgi:hypothetical protein